ncbi:MAG: VOC family protein [Lachnospiraceae bacterium]|nr:VOC family protein [Lachnospiraceae bacterium]
MVIEHIALFVNDLEKARDFFVKYLNGRSDEGYYNPKEEFRSHFITFDDGARLEVMSKPGVADDDKGKERTGYDHLAFSVGSKEKVDELTKQLSDAGYEVLRGPRTTGDGYYESCIVAVEGNRIEITA